MENQKQIHLSISFFFIFFTTFVFIIITQLVVAAPAGGCGSTGYFINVTNEIHHGQNKVMVHCKSKDDDFGMKTIGFNHSVMWTFCENFWGPSTLYFCHFYMGNLEQVFEVFNHTFGHQCVEKPKKNYKRNYWRCTWLIKTDGFYFVDRTTGVRNDVKKYDWKLIGS